MIRRFCCCCSNSEPVVGGTAETDFDLVVLSFKFEFDLLELVLLLLLKEKGIVSTTRQFYLPGWEVRPLEKVFSLFHLDVLRPK